jgi:uncharacterized protein YaeQ
VWDATGVLRAWIDVGSPSAKRLHKAAKAADRVAVYTTVALPLLMAEAASSPIHRVEEIEVWPFEVSFIDGVAAQLDRKRGFALTRSDGTLYLGVGDATYEAPLALARLVATA